MPLENIVDVKQGSDFTICLTSDGELYGFGSNGVGQLGRDDIINNDPGKIIYPPVKIDMEEPIKQISCGYTFTLCLSESGELYVFGNVTRSRNYLTKDSYLPKKINFPDDDQVELISHISDSRILSDIEQWLVHPKEFLLFPSDISCF